MDLTKILSISGKPGLYRMVGEAKNNLIVESLIDGKRSPAFSHEKISTLHEISIYTESEDVPLGDVLKNIFELKEGKPVLDPKKASSKDVKELFEEVLPEYDRASVYVSDMKKVFGWYNFLLEKELLEFSEEEDAAGEQEAETGITEEQLSQAKEKKDDKD